MPQQPDSPSSDRPSAASVEGATDFPDQTSGIHRVRPRAEDLLFVNELSAAGLMEELGASELSDITQKLGNVDGVQRKVDLLELYYYFAGGDEAAARRRRIHDRFFLHRDEDEAATARALVARLRELSPELPDVKLERIGEAIDDPLVLRSGEHFAAVIDDYEEDMDTGDIDLRELEGASISVRGLVRALNILLDRHGVRDRLVPLIADEDREPYLATTLANAMNLCKAGLLEEETAEELIELCAW